MPYLWSTLSGRVGVALLVATLSACTHNAMPASSTPATHTTDEPSFMTPPPVTATSTCPSYLLYASTTTGYLNLTGCPYDTQTPVPSLPIHVGAVVHIAGPETG